MDLGPDCYTYKVISFLLNLPYTFLGVLLAFLLVPKNVRWDQAHRAIIFYVKRDSFGISYMKGWRGMTCGHTIILNAREELNDLAHELIHVEQNSRLPLVFPFFYSFELLRKGYEHNKYEVEAYSRSGSVYHTRKYPVDS